VALGRAVVFVAQGPGPEGRGPIHEGLSLRSSSESRRGDAHSPSP
jgi:hypothetical protein